MFVLNIFFQLESFILLLQIKKHVQYTKRLNFTFKINGCKSEKATLIITFTTTAITTIEVLLSMYNESKKRKQEQEPTHPI